MASTRHEDGTVQGLVQAAGFGSRLGFGPKAFVVLEGRTLLERALDILRDTTDSVVVAVPSGEVERARALVGDHRTTVIAGGKSRSETTRILLGRATGTWLLLHDVVHPFAPKELVLALLQAAREDRSAAPAITNTEFLYNKNGELLHAPGDVLNGQKPVAFARDAIESALAAQGPAEDTRDPSLMQILQAAGIRTRFIDGSPRNIKITSRADLEFARAMIALERTQQVDA